MGQLGKLTLAATIQPKPLTHAIIRDALAYRNAIRRAVMTEFASGERYLNRAWSASANGYVDEVLRSVEHAAAFIQAADWTLAKAVPA